MKFKMLALILALTVISWAQTATQTSRGGIDLSGRTRNSM